MSEQEELIDVKPYPLYLSGKKTEFKSAWPLALDRKIRAIAQPPILHLFSGASSLGDERVDLTHPNSTIKQNVFDFIKTDERDWNFVILDPPWQIGKSKSLDYADSTAISASVPKRQALSRYLMRHADNVLWVDIVCPYIHSFERHAVILCTPISGWSVVRVLTWLQRKGERLS